MRLAIPFLLLVVTPAFAGEAPPPATVPPMATFTINFPDAQIIATLAQRAASNCAIDKNHTMDCYIASQAGGLVDKLNEQLAAQQPKAAPMSAMPVPVPVPSPKE